VTDQHDIAQILELQNAKHVPDMGFEAVVRVRQMRALAQAGIGRRKEIVPGRRHQRPHFFPRPGRRPGAVSNNNDRQRNSLLP
jgi:hypothetical protein